MTLLEVILATTILASITALIAALWTQMRSWSGDAALVHESMTLQRVVDLMQDQWADRRESVALDEEENTVLAGEQGLAFVTSTGILFPDWPLVRVEYTIEIDPDLPPGSGGAPWRLLYRETRITDLTGPPPTGTGADGEPLKREHVLLGRCRELRFEQFFVASPEAARAAGEEAPSRTGEWKTFEDDDEGLTAAVRLLGRHEGDQFSCVFVIRALR